jgi:hypothetical protein
MLKEVGENFHKGAMLLLLILQKLVLDIVLVL